MIRTRTNPLVSGAGVALALCLLAALSVRGAGAQAPATFTPPGVQPGATTTPSPQVTADPSPTMTLMPTPIPTHTPTITPSATATSTRTATPYPTYEPRVTPTLSWPTPGPSAFFTSRYVASTIDPTPIPRGAGALRGRVVDWRGIGLQGFRVQVHSDAAQADAVSSADGQYTVSGIPPGQYEITLPDYRSDPARSIPILAGAVTTVDWIETGRGVPPLAESRTPTVVPSALAVPTPRQVMVERPPDSPARPSPPELAILKAVGFAIDRSRQAFTRGAGVVVAVAIIVGIALWVRSRL